MPSWREVLKIHPACELFPLMTQAELKELGEDIKKNRLQQRVKLWPVDEPPGYVLLDGRNRLDAMEAVGLKLVDNPNAATVEEIFAGDNIRATLIAPIPAKAIDPVAYVISANIRRRHLTCEHKRAVIAELLKADPNRSNLWTAKLVGVDDKTVGSVRRDLEARSEIPNVAKTIDTKGRQQPIRKPKVTSLSRPATGMERGFTSAIKPVTTKSLPSSKANLAPPTQFPELVGWDFGTASQIYRRRRSEGDCSRVWCARVLSRSHRRAEKPAKRRGDLRMGGPKRHPSRLLMLRPIGPLFDIVKYVEAMEAKSDGSW